jgi:hypothetical protein
MYSILLLSRYRTHFPTIGKIMRPTKVSFNPQASTTPSMLKYEKEKH